VLKRLGPAQRRYRLGEITIELPSGHQLVEFQAAHPLYDRFLPFLAAGIPAGRWLIDVGGNVGDTAVAVVQRSQCSILTVEADAHFFRILQRNLARLPPAMQQRIRPVRAFIGTGEIVGTVRTNGQTGAVDPASPPDAALEQLSIDALIERCAIAGEQIAVLKSDVDGFDYDVQLSARGLLREHDPLLFWENQFASPQQEARYEAWYAQLTELGYSRYWIFDNFGNPMAEDVDLQTVLALNRYVRRQNEGLATRTVHYVDILCSRPDSAPQAQAAVAAFLTL